MTVAETLATHATALAAAAAADGEAVEDAVVDWFGVTLGGSTTPVPLALSSGMGPITGTSRVLGTPDRAPAPVAALLNGAAAHALELDDIYAPGTFHPGAPIIAAALAVGDQVDASISDFRMAVTVGYEVGCRVARDLGPAHYAHWHTTGTAGAVGAAAAAAVLLRADGDQTANTLALAATMAAGLQQTFRSDAVGKPLHSGNAAHAGVVAAFAAAGGVSGARDVFEGPAGLAAATGAPTSWWHSQQPFELPRAVEQITVKPFPCCGHVFAPIAAALGLRNQVRGADKIDSVEVHTYAAALTVAGNSAPLTAQERRFSIPYVVAHALTTGRITAASFRTPSDDALQLLPRITLHVDDIFEQRFPERRGARLVLNAGQRTYGKVVPDRPGSPENPLPTDALDSKFVDAAAGVLASRTGEALRRLRGGAVKLNELFVC